MANHRHDPRSDEHDGRASWLDEDSRGGDRGRARERNRDDDGDYTRQLADRYGHGHGGYDRSAYPQGGHGESAADQGGYGRGLSGEPRGQRREQRRPDDDGTPGSRGPFGERGYGEGRGFGASQGDNLFRTGVFMGGADQDFRSGGQYQGESGHGARPGYGSDYSGGGYLGRGSGPRPQYQPRSGGSFGESPRGSYGPSPSHGEDDMGREQQRRGGGHRGRGPKNYTRTDQRITEDLCERLTEDDDVDAGDIEVQVRDGVAVLTGTVGERWMKHRAEDIAEACGGVKDVENRIRVVRGGGDRSGPATPAGADQAADGGTSGA